MDTTTSLAQEAQDICSTIQTHIISEDWDSVSLSCDDLMQICKEIKELK